MKFIKFVVSCVMVVILSLVGCAKYQNLTINDIGLKTLSLLKTAKGGKVDLSQLQREHADLVDHGTFTELLQKYVTEEGLVDYQGFASDSLIFDSYLKLLSMNSPADNWSSDERMAYWINAYNALTVKLILDHYPLESIKEIGKGVLNSPWDKKFFKIHGIDFDLGTIEHEILRKRFDDPRIHFAINCASFSCPRLRTEAYVADRLEEQLEDQTVYFLQNKDKNLIDAKQSKISSIFNWFGSDFKKHRSVKDFIKQYHPEFNSDLDIEYLEYNWQLNS